MKTDCTLVTIEETGYFNKIVNDYVKQAEALQPFYKYEVSLEGLQEAVAARNQFPQQRDILVTALKEQYKDVQVSDALQANIELLLQENTFTVTAAHQPNIFTGPLYFVYKSLHIIQLAKRLNHALPANHFVPVYYMGSEDADLDELGTVTINGQNYKWETKQTGAVGRMKVDKAFIALMETMQGQLGVEAYGDEIVSIFKKHYKENVTIQQATLGVVNELFGAFGLIVLIPDSANLKSVFNDVVRKELVEQFSHQQVAQTIEQLQQNYKVQAGGRELNLFYLIDDKRERIEIQNATFKIQNQALEFSEAEILQELNEHPERFSGNVILRGVFQETILPNVAFIGGGGELAYWLELKKVFEAVHVPYPVLILRNSFLLITSKQVNKLQDLGFAVNDIFKDDLALLNQITKQRSANRTTIADEIEQSADFYDQLKNLAVKIDTTLQAHVEALQVKQHKKLVELEKKLLRAERRKFEAEERQINKLKDALFPKNNLQERVENIAGFYAKFGKGLIETLLEHSLTIEQQFAVVELA